MKRFLTMCAVSLTALTANAQGDFKTPLKATWTAFDTTMAPEGKLQAANKLVLISKKWKDEWSTHFYNSLSKTILSYEEKDAKKHDAMLDEAEKERAEAVSILGKENDETFVLAAMVANSRMAADPMNRWQVYGKKFQDALESAKAINPNNPRMYYMKAVSTYFTPKAFGGGKKAAKPYFEKAATLYEKETEDDITKPYWGRRINAYFLAQCEGNDDDVKFPGSDK
jgi:hypothetical protein